MPATGAAQAYTIMLTWIIQGQPSCWLGSFKDGHIAAPSFHCQGRRLPRRIIRPSSRMPATPPRLSFTIKDDGHPPRLSSSIKDDGRLVCTRHNYLFRRWSKHPQTIRILAETASVSSQKQCNRYGCQHPCKPIIALLLWIERRRLLQRRVSQFKFAR